MFKHVSRRQWLKGLALAVSTSTLSPLIRRVALAAPAASKASPASVQYRIPAGPNHGKHCMMCRYFIPDRKQGMGAMCRGGTCQLVAGPVSPMGYCVLFKSVA
ncbi:MAG: hypothetical protein ACYDDO_15410 [Acidiferrobacterales bacterium]